MSQNPYSWSYRLSRAVITTVFNIVLWILIPSLIFGQLERGLPSSPLTVSTNFVYAFGIAITVLQLLGILTMGMAVSVPFTSGSYFAEAYYIWAAVNGGALAFSAAGLGVALSFRPLLFLLMLPPLFSAVKAPINYLLEQSEAGGPSSDSV